MNFEDMWYELKEKLENMLGYVGYSPKPNSPAQGIQQALTTMTEMEVEKGGRK